MGDQSQRKICRAFVWKYAPQGPILEIGAKRYHADTAVEFRDLFDGQEYVGTDIEPGDGVDVVDDLENPRNLVGRRFGFAICCSVLEHVRRPWVAAEAISDIVAPGGYLYVATPWVWPYHPYPDDYFRFSFSGIASLFPNFEVVEKLFGSLDKIVNASAEDGQFADRWFFENEKNFRLQVHMLLRKQAT